ncbi:MAG: ABC transporter permease [Atopostipes suicloacalis]|nr:ABC transporter permease [Atopostipes suicloacalis]
MTDITNYSLWEQILHYYEVNGSYVIDQFFRHLLMSVYGVVFAAIVAIPLGFYIARKHKIADWVLGIANVIQTIPSLALLSILMLGIGLGPNLVVVTIFIYSLLPILRNTYAGVRNVDRHILDVGKGMGMTNWQIIRKIELPLALSVIIGGIRNAYIAGIGVAALGTFVGAAGLGDVITRGVNASGGESIIIAGVVPISLMAVLGDALISWAEKKLDPVNS